MKILKLIQKDHFHSRNTMIRYVNRKMILINKLQLNKIKTTYKNHKTNKKPLWIKNLKKNFKTNKN